LQGEWMNSSAGVAFSPHVISIEVGEVCYILCNVKFSWTFDV